MLRCLLCAPIVSALVLYSSITGGNLLALERPPFVDEPASLNYYSGDSRISNTKPFRSVLDPPQTITREIRPVSADQFAPPLPNTTNYASVEIPAPAPAYDDDVNTNMNSMILNRLMAVEAELSTLRSDSLVKKVEEQAKKPVYKLGGRIHLDHWAFASDTPGIGFFEHPDPMNSNFGTDPEDRVGFRRVRLELSGENPANMFWRFQIDFAKAEVSEFKDVYIGWKGFPGNQQIQVGNQKRPLGLDHWNSSRFNVFMERPFVVEAHNEDARRPGVGVWGHTDEEDLFWQYGVYQAENIADDGAVIGDNWQPSLNGRIGGSPWYEDDAHWMHWALVGQILWPDGEPDPNDITTDENEERLRTRPEARSSSRWLNTGRIDGASHAGTIALEGMFNSGPFNLTGEAYYTQVARTAGFGPDLDFAGCYLQGAWFLGGDYMTYKRSVGSINRPHIDRFFDPCDDCSPSLGAFQLALRYSYLDVSSQDVLGGVGESFTFGLNWWFSPYARIQFNAIRGSIHDHAPVGGFTAGQYTILGTRYALDF